MRLRARWGARKESLEVCATKMCAFLSELAMCDDMFAQQWIKCTCTREEAMTNPNEIELSVEALQNLLAKGRVRRDLDKSVVEELGYHSRQLWNGRKLDSAFVLIECGAYPNPRILPAANTVWIDLPNDGSALRRVLHPVKLRGITNVVVKNWDPDWARISTNKLDSEVYQVNGYLGQMAGWLTYISDRYGPLPPLPEDCAVERVGELGNLVTITSIRERLTVSNPAYVAAVRRLSEVLERAGFLAPIPPAKPT